MNIVFIVTMKVNLVDKKCSNRTCARSSKTNYEPKYYYPGNDYCTNYTLKDSPPKIEYRLFTSHNRRRYILLNENAEPVNPKKRVDLSNAPLKVVTHGWMSSSDDNSVLLIREGYLDPSYYLKPLNIIAVDWRTLANTFYVLAVDNVKIVGDSISRFLEAVNEKYGLLGRDMHLIGHSLGAHVVGIGAYRTSFHINRVTGLDPAGPLFEFPKLVPAAERIDRSDANFVDIIHTCGGLMGFYRSIGDMDFFPNSGRGMQPDCEDARCPVSCSHAKSYEYFAETILNNELYPSLRCPSWEDFLAGLCDYSSDMGDGVDPIHYGNYCLIIRGNESSRWGKY